MALIEEFDKSGNWLFKYRSYIPLIFYVFAFIVIASSDNELISFQNFGWSMVCLAISFLGLYVRIITIGYTPVGTSGRNTKEGQVAEELNTTGIYSRVRHPLYLGNFLMWLGLFIFVGNIWFVLTCSLAFWIYYERIMFAEEFFLRKKFGETYLEWASKTPAFIPTFRKIQSPLLVFSFKNVLKREYSGFFATILSFSILDFLKHYFYKGDLKMSLHWVILLVFGFIIYISLRSLKKYSNVLHVHGR